MNRDRAWVEPAPALGPAPAAAAAATPQQELDFLKKNLHKYHKYHGVYYRSVCL